MREVQHDKVLSALKKGIWCQRSAFPHTVIFSVPTDAADTRDYPNMAQNAIHSMDGANMSFMKQRHSVAAYHNNMCLDRSICLSYLILSNPNPNPIY